MSTTSFRKIPPLQKTTRNPRTSNYSNKPNGQKGDQYTVPRVKYEYEVVPWEVFLDNTYTGYKTVRSSFIPYTVIEGDTYWLLGSFHDFPKDILMDFGGSCVLWDPPVNFAQGKHQIKNYQHQFGCAILELNEESKGLLVQPVLRSLGTFKPIVYRGADNQRKEYVWFVMVPLPFAIVSDVPGQFKDAPYILKGEELGPLDFYRESDILNKKYRTSRNLTDFIDHLSKY